MPEVECVGRIEAVVLEALAFCDKDLSSDQNIPLFEGGLELDSISFLDLILEIEGKLDLRLRSEELTGEAVQTVGGLVRHIAAVMPESIGSA
jgi:acyl carrier protein